MNELDSFARKSILKLDHFRSHHLNLDPTVKFSWYRVTSARAILYYYYYSNCHFRVNACITISHRILFCAHVGALTARLQSVGKNEIEHQLPNITSILDEITDNLKNAIATKIETQDKAAASSRITNKLNRLYKGNIVIPKATKTHINLSDFSPTKHQEALLSLGIKCHCKPTFDILKKQTELETN